MKKLLLDILRDKNCDKFSITKLLALLSFIFLLCYLIYTTFICHETESDHLLVVEIMGFIGGLLGFKNRWGTNREIEKRNVNRKVYYDDTIF